MIFHDATYTLLADIGESDDDDDEEENEAEA